MTYAILLILTASTLLFVLIIKDTAISSGKHNIKEVISSFVTLCLLLIGHFFVIKIGLMDMEGLTKGPLLLSYWFASIAAFIATLVNVYILFKTASYYEVASKSSRG